MDTQTAETIIRETLDKVGARSCPMPRVRFTKAYTYAGKAVFRIHGREIWLSQSFMGATREGQRQTLIHEACHIAEHFLTGRCTPHGTPWKLLMLIAGVQPDVCSNDPGALAVASRLTWHRATWVFCACSAHRVSTQRRAAIAKRPGSYICRLCRTALTLEDQCTPAAQSQASS